MLTDLAVFIDWVTKIRKVTIVLVRGIQPRVVHVGQQACTLGEEGILSCQSFSHLAKLRIWRARKLGEEEDHLARMT